MSSLCGHSMIEARIFLDQFYQPVETDKNWWYVPVCLVQEKDNNSIMLVIIYSSKLI